MGKIIAITEKEKELVKDYHSKEYNDKSIVEATGLSYNKVYYIRHMLLKLPPYNKQKIPACQRRDFQFHITDRHLSITFRNILL